MYAECLLTNSILFFLLRLFWRFNGSAAFVFLLDMKSLQSHPFFVFDLYFVQRKHCHGHWWLDQMQLHEYVPILNATEIAPQKKKSYRSQTQCMRAEFKFGSDLISSECVCVFVRAASWTRLIDSFTPYISIYWLLHRVHLFNLAICAKIRHRTTCSPFLWPKKNATNCEHKRRTAAINHFCFSSFWNMNASSRGFCTFKSKSKRYLFS